MQAAFVNYKDGRSVDDVLQEIIDQGGGVGPQGPPGPQGPKGDKGDKGDSGTGCFIANYGTTTAEEIIDFLDNTEKPFSPILVERSGSYYTALIAQKMAANKVILMTLGTSSGNLFRFTYTITGGTWANASKGVQDILTSGVNIKTINGETLLGSGDISV